MIEAVNSVLQNAPLVRGNVEQVSTADSFAVNPDRVQKIPQAPFVSPRIVVDVNFDKAVIQIRDGETGDVVNQFPSESRLREGTRQAASQQKVSAPPPASRETNSQAVVQESSPAGDGGSSNAITAQQQAAFESAARTASPSGDTGSPSGDTGSQQGSGKVTVFA